MKRKQGRALRKGDSIVVDVTGRWDTIARLRPHVCSICEPKSREAKLAQTRATHIIPPFEMYSVLDDNDL